MVKLIQCGTFDNVQSYPPAFGKTELFRPLSSAERIASSLDFKRLLRPSEAVTWDAKAIFELFMIPAFFGTNILGVEASPNVLGRHIKGF